MSRWIVIFSAVWCLALGVFVSKQVTAQQWDNCPPSHPIAGEFNGKVFCLNSSGKKIVLPDTQIPKEEAIDSSDDYIRDRVIRLDRKVESNG